MVRPLVGLCCLLAFLISIVSVTAEDAKIGEWKKLEDSGVVIEYQQESEEVAKQLLPELVKQVKDVPSPGSKEHLAQLDEFARQKDKSLQFIASQLGLDKPGQNMIQTYDGMLNSLRKIVLVIPDAKHVRLWQKEKLKTILTSGQKVPGFTYDAASDSVNLQMNFSVDDNTTTRKDEPLPIVISEDIPAMETVQKVLHDVNGVISGFTGFLYPANAIYHDVAVNGIAGDVGVRTAFARWFIEGIANNVSSKCLDEFPTKIATPVPPVWEDPSKFQSLKSKVDLLSWRSEAWEVAMPDKVEGELLAAHMAFATSEIKGLVDRHDEDTIPEILKEFAKSEKRDRDAIFAAIKKVTGEDIKPALEKYGSSAQDNFKGLAIINFGVAATEKSGEDKLSATDTAVIPLATDGTRGLAVHFNYETLNPPVDLRVEVSTADGKVLVEESIELTKPADGLVWHPMFTEDFKPGDHVVKLYFDKKLFKEVPVKLVTPEDKE